MFKRFMQRFKKNLSTDNTAGFLRLVRMEAEYYKQQYDRIRCFEFWFRHMIRGEVQAIEEQGRKPSQIVVKYSLGGCHDTLTFFNGIQIIHDPDAKELITVECGDERK